MDLFVLHGLLGRGREWSEVLTYLSTGSAPDLLGHGDAEPLAPGPVWPQYRDQLDGLLPARCVLAGHSMGGIVALRYAAERPDRVDRLVLMEAGVQANTAQSLAGLARWITEDWPARFASAPEARAFLDRCGLHPRWETNLTPDLAPAFDADSCAAAISELDAVSRMRDLQALRCPLHLILGDGGLLEPEDVAKMRQHPACHRPIEIAGAGHDLHLDQPKAVAEALRSIR